MPVIRRPVLPGGILGVFGGGQLGRMFAIAARKMGFRVHVFDPQPGGPASQICDQEFNADYSDLDAVRSFASGVDVISFEFENIPRDALLAAASACAVHPSPDVLFICQNREREKTFLNSHRFPCAKFAVVSTLEELETAVETIGWPSVLKTAVFGYDGKGQRKLEDGCDLAAIWQAFEAPRAVLEAWVPFQAELSVVVARGRDGSLAAFPPSENVHVNHILDLSIAPARFPESVRADAVTLAERIARELDVVGLLAVEFFVNEDGSLLVNELAPRPHNSGHFSFDACVTSQFEQQVRAVCGLPLGSTRLLTPVVMWNLLGDLWAKGEPDWVGLLGCSEAQLHLYGKHEPRVGRKMGHVCVLDEIPSALASINQIREKLGPHISHSSGPSC